MDLGGQLRRTLRELDVGLQQRAEPSALLFDVTALGVGHPSVVLGLRLVAIGLTGRREQDQRGGVRGLRREGEVQQDEGVRVPAQAQGDDVEGNPDCDEQRLADDELRGPEEAREPLGELAEAICAEWAVLVLAHAVFPAAFGAGAAQTPTNGWGRNGAACPPSSSQRSSAAAASGAARSTASAGA
jgi:hypothetical protein